MPTFEHCIIIGSSRGLGAALVNKFLENGKYIVIGVARTKLKDIDGNDKWSASGKYRHIELDIGSSIAQETLSLISSELPHEKVCIIFNAAIVKSDITSNGCIDAKAFDEINSVGINGFGNVIKAFEKHLLTYGGILAGISSFSSYTPPAYDPRVAYPASKAYMDMALRCLRYSWWGKAKVITIHLGYLGHKRTFPFKFLYSSYEVTARKIFNLISGKNVPPEVNYPLIYCLVYKYILKCTPDVFYLWFFKKLLNHKR